MMDPRLEVIVERMLDKYDSSILLVICFLINEVLISIYHKCFFFRCILDGKYQQAMGMAVECRRLDKLEEAITRCDNLHVALSYCINLSHQYVGHREYRCEVKA
jgi:26S proteasome regulatory subunit N2